MTDVQLTFDEALGALPKTTAKERTTKKREFQSGVLESHAARQAAVDDHR